jgi:hypothetical protein
MQEQPRVKVLFRFYSRVLEKDVIETMWAVVIDKSNGLYKLDSIPFYGPPIASGDIFFAEFDKDEDMLIFRKVRKISGNSIVQVILLKDPFDTTGFRDTLTRLGCIYEGLKDRYFAVEIPAKENYLPVKVFLESLKQSGTIDYAEAVLSDGHL